MNLRNITRRGVFKKLDNKKFPQRWMIIFIVMNFKTFQFGNLFRGWCKWSNTANRVKTMKLSTVVPYKTLIQNLNFHSEFDSEFKFWIIILGQMIDDISNF